MSACQGMGCFQNSNELPCPFDFCLIHKPREKDILHLSIMHSHVKWYAMNTKELKKWNQFCSKLKPTLNKIHQCTYRWKACRITSTMINDHSVLSEVGSMLTPSRNNHPIIFAFKKAEFGTWRGKRTLLSLERPKMLESMETLREGVVATLSNIHKKIEISHVHADIG